MTQTPPKPQKTAQTKPSSSQEDRLAGALRENLLKRKQQQRARATESPDNTPHIEPASHK